ncbi:Gfo/Idh/MocA family protein [Streptomyces sp. NPDC091217]|uniref:Gfo/Idh/MocA family protein n=1 Tax=Streptomyces sp. NPDC091217 TaxID=3365975 RepID=UPI003820005F
MTGAPAPAPAPATATGPGIGIIGVGGVARYAHLPAYRRLGLNVTAVCDVDETVAADVAEEFRIPHRFRDAADLVAHPDVAVIDIATPPASHLELMTAVAEAGKPMLVQKPLCTTRSELDGIRRLRDLGARVRLNMTGRQVSAWRKVRDLLRSGAIGQPYLCTIRNRDWWDREPGRWDHTIDDYIVFEMAIHHLDLCAYWFGPAVKVTGRAGTHPGQLMKQANWISATLEYPDAVVVQLLEDWTLPEFSFAEGHPFEEVVISGSSGVIRAGSERVALADPGGNTVRMWHLPRPGQSLPGEQLETGWFPDSFGHSMRDYLDDLAAGRGAEEDWDHLVRLTEETFAVSASLSSDLWVPCRTERTAPGTSHA